MAVYSYAEQFTQIKQHGFDSVDTEIQYVERNMDLHGSPEFEDNWKNDGTTLNASFNMKLTCKNLLIVMKDSGDSAFGKADVFVDGAFAKTLDPLAVGWNHSTALILIDEKEAAEHEIVIRMHPGEEHKMFTIQGFGVTWN